MSVLKVTKAMFETELKTTDKVVMLDFYADWCGPCNMVAPLVAELAEENPDYCIGKVNVDDEPELANRFGIASIPTVLIFKNGKLAETSIGYREKEAILALLK